MTDYSNLRAKAEKANDTGVWVRNGYRVTDAEHATVAIAETTTDAAYIAAASPSTILALLARLEKAEAVLRDIGYNNWECTTGEGHAAAVWKARAFIEEGRG